MSLTIPALAKAPFKARRLDPLCKYLFCIGSSHHLYIIARLRAKDLQTMLNFYVGVLGAEPHELPNGGSSVGRFACLFSYYYGLEY